MRQAAGLPPFGRLAGADGLRQRPAGAEGHARALGRAAPATRMCIVLGPAEAPIAVVRGRHRFRMLVKTAREFPMQDWLRG